MAFIKNFNSTKDYNCCNSGFTKDYINFDSSSTEKYLHYFDLNSNSKNSPNFNFAKKYYFNFEIEDLICLNYFIIHYLATIDNYSFSFIN